MKNIFLLLPIFLLTTTNAFSNDEFATVVKTGSFDTIQSFITNKRININKKDSFGYPPLFYAIHRNDLNITKLLISNNADVNSSNDNGETPLILAVQSQSIPIIELLLQNGAKINAKNRQGSTVIFYAIQDRNIEIVYLLLKNYLDINLSNDEDVSPLLWAALLGDLDMVRLLIKQGADIYHRDKYGATLLHYSIDAMNFELLRYVTELGIDPFIIETGTGYSAMGLAQKFQSREAISILEEYQNFRIPPKE